MDSLVEYKITDTDRSNPKERRVDSETLRCTRGIWGVWKNVCCTGSLGQGVAPSRVPDRVSCSFLFIYVSPSAVNNPQAGVAKRATFVIRARNANACYVRGTRVNYQWIGAINTSDISRLLLLLLSQPCVMRTVRDRFRRAWRREQQKRRRETRSEIERRARLVRFKLELELWTMLVLVFAYAYFNFLHVYVNAQKDIILSLGILLFMASEGVIFLF